MGEGGGKRGGSKPRITALAMGEYVERLRRGENFEAAARGAGHSRSAFFQLRKRDAEFAAACAAAVARSSGKTFIHGTRGRKFQLRKTRRTVFTAERQDIFLAHFAGTADTAASAAKAGVSESTVDSMRRRDPDFDRRFRETLDFAHVKLEADLAARRIAEQKRLRDLEPTGEPEPEFERAMRLLERLDRLRRRPPAGAARGGVEERWDFGEAIVLLGRKLRNMGLPIEPLPPGHERPDGDLPLLPAPPEGDEREPEGREDGDEWEEGDDREDRGDGDDEGRGDGPDGEDKE